MRQNYINGSQKEAHIAPGRAISLVTLTTHQSDRQDSETEAQNEAQQAQKGVKNEGNEFKNKSEWTKRMPKVAMMRPEKKQHTAAA